MELKKYLKNLSFVSAVRAESRKGEVNYGYKVYVDHAAIKQGKGGWDIAQQIFSDPTFKENFPTIFTGVKVFANFIKVEFYWPI